jgi:muramoyltetrapeptide carboxypeptidase LdcA involved in peptidoglycan recycling
MNFAALNKLKKGDRVAVLSPSFAAPGKWPHVYELGLRRLEDIFGLVPVEFAATRKLGASKAERSADLIGAFEDRSIKAVITTLGGNDQVTYVNELPARPFVENPKPFFGFSDNTHFMNFLWLNGVPSYYGGALFTQFATQGRMDDFTIGYLNRAFFEHGGFEIKASGTYNDIGLGWDDAENLKKERTYEANDGWAWDGRVNTTGVTWGGCLESIDEALRHGAPIPSLKDFEGVILITETSEEIPSSDYVFRVYRALGERGILERVKAILVGRPKAWEFDKQRTADQKREYRREQHEVSLRTIRRYNQTAPIIQNLDFGHTDPQIPFPYGREVEVISTNREIVAQF